MDDDTEPASRGEQRRQRVALVVALLLLCLGGGYAALAIGVRVDSIFFPGNELTLPGPLARAPGLNPAVADTTLTSDRINVLILGLDRRPHRVEADGPPRTDSISIISVDPVTKTGGIVGIPRDLYVQAPNPQGRSGSWLIRINTAYHYGALYGYPGGGPALARETIEQTVRTKINYYIVVDWVAFADVIDALGGVDVTVPTTLRQVEAFNVRDANSYRIDIAAGPQTMDSITALAYSRYRDDLQGDLGRVKRQQQVMQAAMDKAIALGWLANAPALWSRFRGSIETDITPARLPGLIALARQIGPERLTAVSLAGENGEAVRSLITPQGEDVLVPVWDKMTPILQTVLYDRRLREEGARVRILNGSSTRGLATRVAGQLTRSGLSAADVVAADTDPTERRTESVVLDFGGKDYTARRIAEALGLPKSAVQRPGPNVARPAGDPDVVVLIGQDLKLPAESPYDVVGSR